MARSKKSVLVLAALVIACFALAAMTVIFYGELKREMDHAATPPSLPEFQSTKTKAESGDSEAAEILGEIYAEGKQVRQSYQEAAKWYRVAADHGNAKAQYNLGVLFDIGQGVAKDEAEAARWYRKAAEQGNTDAQYTLAGMYGLGRGVAPDPKQALDWYRRAAEQGEPLARYNLAERYERGRDVPQDFVEAYKWHSLAADQGLSDAASARDNLSRNLSSEQLADARKRIEEFKAKHPDRRR